MSVWNLSNESNHMSSCSRTIMTLNTMSNRSEMSCIILAACLIALVVVGPFFLEYRRSDGYSPLSMNSLDEGDYLSVAFSIGEQKPSFSFYYEHDSRVPLYKLLLEQPNRWIDYIVGGGAKLVGLTQVEVGLILDLVCVFLSSVIFLRLFQLLGCNLLSSLGCSLVVLLLPYVLVIPESGLLYYLGLDQLAGSRFVDARLDSFPYIPVLRGIYTQLSYPLFGYCLFKSSQAIEGGGISKKSCFGLGSLCGILLYFYVYGWIAASFLCGGILVFSKAPCAPGLHSGVFKESVKRAIFFFMGNCLLAAPALLMILFSQSSLIMSIQELEKYWYLPIEYVFLLVLGGSVLFGSARWALDMRTWCNRGNRRTAIHLMVLCLVTELVFSNFQPFFGLWLEPFHVGWLYTWPLLSGMCVYLISSFLRSTRWPRVLDGIFHGSIVLFSLGLLFSYMHFLSGSLSLRDDIESMSRYLDSYTPENSVVVAMPTEGSPADDVPRISAIPGMIRTLAHRKILFQLPSRFNSLPLTERFAREYLTNWLYQGRIGPLLACPPKEVPLPGDLFAWTRSVKALARRAECLVPPTSQELRSACDLLQKFKVDYVLWDESYQMPISRPLQQFGSIVWTSDDNRFKLFHFDQKEALETECKRPNLS